MGRSPPYSSPESNIEIKVQPRHTDIHPIVGPPPNRYGQNRHHGPPPPMTYQPYIEKKWFPWIVPSIFVVNIVFFVISMDLNNCPQKSNSCLGASFLGRFAFQPTHENPLLGPSSTTLQSMGALEVNKVVGQREIWRLASCMWLHAGVFHLLANMLSLLFVGISLEREFGFVRIFLLYVICGIGGSLLSSLFASTTISVGASGALFGLLGAMLSELITNWTMYENKFGALFTLLLITAINLAVGILPHVDNFAHLGGFTTGFLLGFILLLRPQFGWISQRHVSPGSLPSKSKSKYKTYQYVLLVLSLLLLIAGFAIGLTLLLRKFDGNKHCSWCHYLRCIPTPFWSCTEARCSSIQYGNQYNLTCIQNQKSRSYVLEYDNSTSHIKKLCVELCR